MTPPRTACLLAGLLVALAAAGCAAQQRARVVAVYPHDPAAFTEGLLYANGALFESTGGYGRSTLRRVDPASGSIEASRRLAGRYFGEGLALAGGKLYQLTWQSHTAFVYDPDTLARLGRRHYAGQGWGLTFDGRALILSDGSATLRFVDPRDFHPIRRLRVTRAGRPVDDLNELEYIDGEIWANVWHADRILRIDPDTGQVRAVLDAADLRRRLPKQSKSGVLNGIAWDARARRLLVTGKNWPALFELAYP